MKTKHNNRWVTVLSFFTVLRTAFGQGTFQNLDFENGVFIPIPGQFNTVEFAPAMPGWRGYLGSNQVDWILYNSQFLSLAGISIYGPTSPADTHHGQYYVQLENSFPVATDVPALAQTGTLPANARSIQFLSLAPFAIGFTVTFGGTPIPLSLMGSPSNNKQIWGGDISALAGLTGELRFRGSGTLDFIQFSNQPIPEPSTLGMFGLGALLFGYRLCRMRKS